MTFILSVMNQIQFDLQHRNIIFSFFLSVGNIKTCSIVAEAPPI